MFLGSVVRVLWNFFGEEMRCDVCCGSFLNGMYVADVFLTICFPLIVAYFSC